MAHGNGTLFLVGTPIGNLGDLSDRARKTLGSVDVVACEDTRRTGRLLASFGIRAARLVSFFEGNERQRVAELVRLLTEGSDVAVVSDAGMPGLSDPGYRLVAVCVEQGVPVDVVPGPSAAVFPATPVATRNHDVEHPYRADSDLFWLTGFEEPEAVAVLSTDGKPLTLFVRPRDREREIWNGRRAGVEGAKAAFGADQAFTVDELEKELPALIGSARTLYYRLGAVDPGFDARIARLYGASDHSGTRVVVKGKAGSLVMPDPSSTVTTIVLGDAGECASVAWHPPSGTSPRCRGDAIRVVCK